MGFSEEVETAGREMGGGGDFYKFHEGDNKMRLMSEPLIKVFRFGYGICYEGAPYCQKATLDKELEEAKTKAKAEGKDPNKATIRLPSKKWSCWAIIRGKEGESTFAIVDLPYGVSKELKELMESDEAGWKGWPMPFDINIKAKGAGTLKVEYQLISSRKETAITATEQEEFEKLTPVSQILDHMKTKQKEKVEGSGGKVEPEYPTAESEDINPDDIPF